ncbi:MAG: ribose-phosphate pyrophosphokinase [Parcubacteria group bacterium LiPW_39]|nr:MAG: ribose-phosphate pyrophosphokinase [Parcubacteria group bacterium LiPW_39]
MIFSGESNLSLAKTLARETGLKLGKILIEKFSDGEIYVRVQEDVKGKKVFVLQSLSYPSGENLMELLIMVDALKEMAPQKITAILPFYAYRRQEKKLKQGESITARLVAKLLETAGVDAAILVDIHSDKILDFFTVPAKNIEATDLFVDYFRKLKLKNAMVVAPDKGAFEDAKRFAKKLNLDAIFITKERRTHDKVESMTLSGSVKGKNIIIIDDEIDTAGTISKAAELLKSRGAKNIYVGCTHAVFSGPAMARLKRASIKKIVTTDTISIPRKKRLNKLSVISAASKLAEFVANEVKHNQHFR